MLSGINAVKFYLGMFMLVETVGVTLLEPLLVALPKPLQCLRVGPLAAPGRYSARDWLITNWLCHVSGTLYLVLAHKNLFICGWSRDRFPWTVPELDCDNKPQSFINAESFSDPQGAIGIIAMPFILLAYSSFFCLKRKLPSWGEPPIEEVVEEEGRSTAKTHPAPAPAPFEA